MELIGYLSPVLMLHVHVFPKSPRSLSAMCDSTSLPTNAHKASLPLYSALSHSPPFHFPSGIPLAWFVNLHLLPLTLDSCNTQSPL